jgi:uncharacterized membrane protein
MLFHWLFKERSLFGMKIILGILMVLGGIFLGLYVGLWLCFVGGIVQILNEIKSPADIETLNIVFGAIKIVVASLAGRISASILIVPGFALISYDKRRGIR